MTPNGKDQGGGTPNTGAPPSTSKPTRPAKKFPRKGAWCRTRDGKLARIEEYPCLDRGFKNDVDEAGRSIRRAMVTPDDKSACIALMSDDGIVTGHRRAVPVRELRKAKLSEIPEMWRSGHDVEDEQALASES